MQYYNLEKLAADMGDMRRFARRDIWNAPNRTTGPRAMIAKALGPGLRRMLRRADTALERTQDRVRAEYRENPWFTPDGGAEDRFVNRHRDVSSAFMRKRYAEFDVSANRSAAMGDEGAHEGLTHEIRLHGPHSGPAERLGVALHENNERITAQGIEGKLGMTMRRAAQGKDISDLDSFWPRAASRVLALSSHVTPSVPLRDLNIANTATGEGADELRRVVHGWRLQPRDSVEVFGTTLGTRSEIEELVDALPSARALLQNANMLPGQQRPAAPIPRYVQHAQDRLVGASSTNPLSPAVRARLQRMVDTHAANAAPPPMRLNQNELRMIDDEFHKLHNPDFPQLLRRRGRSARTPATRLPPGYRQAYENAIKEQRGLTRKQFLAR